MSAFVSAPDGTEPLSAAVWLSAHPLKNTTSPFPFGYFCDSAMRSSVSEIGRYPYRKSRHVPLWQQSNTTVHDAPRGTRER